MAQLWRRFPRRQAQSCFADNLPTPDSIFGTDRRLRIAESSRLSRLMRYPTRTGNDPAWHQYSLEIDRGNSFMIADVKTQIALWV